MEVIEYIKQTMKEEGVTQMEVSWILIKTHCTLFLKGKHLDSEN